MSISPDPGGTLPREEASAEQQRRNIPPPPPPQPQAPPPGYSYPPPPPPQYAYGPPPTTEQQYGYAQPATEPKAKWFPPVVIVGLVLLAGAQIFVAHDLNTSRQ